MLGDAIENELHGQRGQQQGSDARCRSDTNANVTVLSNGGIALFPHNLANVAYYLGLHPTGGQSNDDGRDVAE